MPALGKTGVAIEAHTMKTLNQKAESRGESKSRLISSTLSEVIPKTRGKDSFLIEVLDDGINLDKGKIDLVAVNKDHIKTILGTIEALLTSRRVMEHGLVDGRFMGVWSRSMDSMLALLNRVLRCKLTDDEDLKKIREFFQANPVCLERLHGVKRSKPHGQR